MNIATALADYSLGEADLLRRAMGKKKAAEMAEQKSRFEKGAAKNKIDPNKAAHIFDLMEKFAGYGFNKSHSAAYAMVAYQTAYLKKHYPAEFMAALLTCESGNTDKITLYISECRDMGIEVLPPHVNNSFEVFHVLDGKIVFGLAAVKNVGEGAVASIIEARSQAGPFCTMQDFARRVDLRKVNKKVIESLIKCGAFDHMAATRRAMVESLDSVLEQAAAAQREKAEGQFNLFAAECEPGEPANITDAPIPVAPEWDDLTKLSFEKDLLGFYITGHPLTRFEESVRKFTNALPSTVGAMPSGSQVRMAGLVKKCKEITARKGRMAFVTIEDLKGSIEVIVFSDLYLQSLELLQSGEPLLIVGTRDGEQDTPKILASEIHRLQDAPRFMSKSIQIMISARGTDPLQIKELRTILERHPGRLPVKLHVVIPNRTETVISLPSVACDPSEALVASVHKSFGQHSISFE